MPLTDKTRREIKESFAERDEIEAKINYWMPEILNDPELRGIMEKKDFGKTKQGHEKGRPLNEIDVHKAIRGNITGTGKSSLEVRIPKEARDLLNVDETTFFSVKVDVKNERIILEKVKDENLVTVLKSNKR